MNIKRILVLVMTFAMLLATFAPTLGVFAESEDHIEYDEDTLNAVVEAADLVDKILTNLEEEGLLGEEEYDQIIEELLDLAYDYILGEEITTNDVAIIALSILDIIFVREELTLKNKIEILVVVHETLEEEGYATRENLELIWGYVQEYYDEAYFETYKYLDDNGYIDDAVIGIDKAIEGIYVAIDAIESGLLGITDGLAEEFVNELYATIDTLNKVKDVLAHDKASTVEDLLNVLKTFESDLYTHLTNLGAICGQGYVDYGIPALEMAKEFIETEVLPVVKMYAKMLEEKITNAVEPIIRSFWRLVAICEELKINLEDIYNEIIDIYETLCDIYGDAKDALLTLNGILINIVDRAEREIYKAIKLFNNICSTLEDVYGTVESIVVVADQIFDIVYDILDGNIEVEQIFNDIVAIAKDAYGETEDVHYVASQIYAYVMSVVVANFEGNYIVTENSLYVSLGDAVYGKELANMLTLGDKYYNFDLDGNYLDKVAQADLVTIKLDNGEVIEFAKSLIQHGSDALDWNKYLDAEGQSALNNVLVNIKTALLANGKAQELSNMLDGLVGIPSADLNPEAIADMGTYAIECVLYSYSEFISRMAVTLENVYAVAPDATVVLTGVQNPLDTFNFGINLSEYSSAVDAVVVALNLNLVVAAFANTNTIFVNSNNAKDIFDALNVTFANDDPVVDTCNHVYDDCFDTTCNLCGEVRVAPGHSFTNYVYNNDAACEKNGTETAKCDNCDAETTREREGTALEHQYGDWSELRPATSEQTGLKERTCKVCGHKDIVELPMLPPEDIKVSPWMIAAVVGLLVICILLKKKKPANKKASKKK